MLNMCDLFEDDYKEFVLVPTKEGTLLPNLMSLHTFRRQASNAKMYMLLTNSTYFW